MLAFAFLVLLFGHSFAQDFYNCEADPKCQVLATGLTSPRHLDVAGHTFYIAEAGTGGDRSHATDPHGNCFPFENLGYVCYGVTGGISKATWDDCRSGRGATRILTTPSFETDTQQSIGVSDVVVSGNFLYFAVGFFIPPGFGPFQLQDWIGTVRKLPLTGRNRAVTLVADVAAYEFAHNPEGEQISSNVNGLTQGDRRCQFYAADAAGNAIYCVNQGAVSLVAVLNDYQIGGQSIDYVPTAVRLGRDGNLYVSNLVGFTPTGAVHGGAKIVRITLNNHGGPPRIDDVATGFTNIIDFDIDVHGDLLVLEISDTGLPALDGAVWKVSANGRSRVALIGANSSRGPLLAPGGIRTLPGERGFVVTEGSVLPNGRLLYFDIST